LKSQTIVEATIIEAPPSPKNDTQALVHPPATTLAGTREFELVPKLLPGQDRVVYGDRAC